MNCARCHKPLTDPDSVRRDFGPVCWAAVEAERYSEDRQTNIVRIPDDKDNPEDILVMQLNDGRIATNVEQRIVRHSPTGFNIGYGGSGPSDFALNILARFVPKSAAECMHQDFKWQFIATMHLKEGETFYIKGSAIKHWIKNHKLWKGGE